MQNRPSLGPWCLAASPTASCASPRDRRLALVHDADAAVDTPHELVERRARAHSMRLVLDEMRPTEREALLLRYEAELSFTEVGEVLGIDEQTARKRVSRALVRLRELCQQEGMS